MRLWESMKYVPEVGGERRAPILARAKTGFVILHIVALFFLGCVTQTVAPVTHPAGPTPPELPKDDGFKVVPFTEFTDDQRGRSIRLEVALPATYEKAILPMPSTHTYWMPREKVQSVAETRELPVDTGYFYSYDAHGVGYDITRNLFVGFEDSQEEVAPEKIRLGIENFEWARADLQGYPAIFLRFEAGSPKRPYYMAYIATLYGDHVVHVTYLPANGDPTGGLKTWDRFRSALTGVR